MTHEQVGASAGTGADQEPRAAVAAGGDAVAGVTVDVDGVVVEAMWQVVAARRDFADWLANVLARVAARAGSTEQVLAGRSGSWEADFVRRLIAGTVGWNDEYLAHYGPVQQLCVNDHDRLQPAVAVQVTTGLDGSVEVWPSLCAQCSTCLYCQRPATVFDTECDEPMCAECAAEFEVNNPGARIVRIDSEEYRQLTAPAATTPEAAEAEQPGGGER